MCAETASRAQGRLRNTCKVLLTRGMRGSVVPSTDPETYRVLTGPLRGEVTSVARREASMIMRLSGCGAPFTVSIGRLGCGG